MRFDWTGLSSMRKLKILAAFAMSAALAAPASALEGQSRSQPAFAPAEALALPPAIEPPAELSDSELERGLKQFAVGVAHALTNYEADEAPGDIVSRLPERANPEAAMPAARALPPERSWSRGRLVYPQFGGLMPERASVMIVVEQQIGTPSGIRTETRTLDIRIGRDEEGWIFEQLASDGGDPVERPEVLSPEAEVVLDNPRIELPDSARWDIHAGRVAPELLALMARAAEHTPFGVIVFDSGHPWNIFGTDRMSDHSRGVAVDVHRIGDRLVIDDRAEGSVTHDFVSWLYDQPDLANIGSPWALDGFGGRSFTDLLHQDHLHIAVSRAHALRTE